MARTVSQSRPAAVAAVLARSHEWVSARRKSDGKPFLYVPGSKPGVVYMVAEDGCTCPAARVSETGACKHQAAVRQHQARRQKATAPRRSYRDIFGVCDVRTCDEDREPGERFCERHALTDAF